MKDFIINIAKEAGQIAMKYLGNAKISNKGPKDVVTEADIAVENFIKSKINEKYPTHNIVAEESDNPHKNSEFTWYIDPIDGTGNYSHSDPHFCISIALVQNDELTHACLNLVALNEFFYAQKGEGAYLNGQKISVSKIDKLIESRIQVGISPIPKYIDDSLKVIKYFYKNASRARDYGFCAGQLAYVACGRAEGLFKIAQHPWDIAAGILIIEEAGGRVTDEKGNKIILGDSKAVHNILASNNILHQKLIDAINSDELKEIKMQIDQND